MFSFYKVFGPHYAVLWGRHELLLQLASLNHYFITSDTLPYKLQPGNVNYELSYGCIGISDYLDSVGTALGAPGDMRSRMQHAFDAFERHEDALAEQLLAYLRGKAGVRIIGRSHVSAGQRVPTVSFVVRGAMSEAIVLHTDRFGIGIRFGDFYAKRLIEALGLQARGGVVRVSIAHYNTPAEMAHLITHLDAAIDAALDTDPTFIAGLADLVQQAMAGPEVNLDQAAELPTRVKLYPQEKWAWGWNNSSEVWNGRLAMIGFSAFLLELLSGRGPLHALGLL